ncbi:MAG TPA: hypothetical protein VFG21_02055, partial [Xanthomonadaceae bacterium]|nr:hypothetical protein [Xanthomonadaceae bacterium]
MSFRIRLGTLSAFAQVRLAVLVLLLGLPLAALAQGIYPAPAAAPEIELRVTGTVEVIVPYGTGYVIGGNFTQINGSDRRNIALVDASGALADGGFVAGWATAGADATVRALAVSGDELFAGGDFTSFGGQSRSFVAKVSLLDGSVDADFQPAPNGVVRALALDAGRGQVFLGGTFTAVDGSARDRAAKVDADDGILVAGWIPGY